MAERTPRLGFLGVGWIGRQRMEAVARAGAASVAAIADPDRRAAEAAAAAVGGAEVCSGLRELLARELDGLVIATPTALHAAQAQAALEHGLPVFCQKPLARTAGECTQVIEFARRVNVRLSVDLSYRHLAAVQAALRALEQGRIGRPHAAELIFHNAYGPDKPWVRQVELAGGGALTDLGWHLIDLARLFLGPLRARSLHADLYALGRRLEPNPDQVEDLALAQITLTDGRALRIACSWWLSAGCDAVIEASFYGAEAALRIRNRDGSFYDFEALLVEGRRVTRLAEPPDEWGGRALIAWAQQIAADPSFDPEVERLLETAALIDAIYGRTA